MVHKSFFLQQFTSFATKNCLNKDVVLSTKKSKDFSLTIFDPNQNVNSNQTPESWDLLEVWCQDCRTCAELDVKCSEQLDRGGDIFIIQGRRWSYDGFVRLSIVEVQHLNTLFNDKTQAKKSFDSNTCQCRRFGSIQKSDQSALGPIYPDVCLSKTLLGLTWHSWCLVLANRQHCGFIIQQ